jgi:hypothetical protein
VHVSVQEWAESFLCFYSTVLKLMKIDIFIIGLSIMIVILLLSPEGNGYLVENCGL